MNPLYKLLHLNLTERVILVLRRHWFVFFKKVLVFLIWNLAPVIIYAILNNFYPEIIVSENSMALLLLLGSGFYLFLWLTLFYTFTDYYLDMWVVTNQEIIDVKQKGLFHRVVVKQPLSRIQDVEAKSQGFSQTFLNYGEVKIQTAGAEGKFVFEEIPNPYKIADKINDLVKKQIYPVK